MPTTLKDIAAAAGVSIGTVERALKGAGRISPETAKRIQNLAKEMNYSPNKIAAGLASRGRKYKIAVVFHIMGNEFFNEIIRGIKKAEKEIRDYGMYIQMYYCRDFDAEMQLENINLAIKEGANAIVIVPINSPIIASKIRQLKKEKFPVVFLTTYLNRVSCLCTIRCDYFRSGRIGGMLIDRLSGREGKVMAFLPSNSMLGNNARREGIEVYFHNASPKLQLEKVVVLSNNPEEDNKLIIKELQEHQEVNCILYCGNADIALTAMEEVNRKFTCVFYDLFSETRNALLDGKIDSVIVQSPKEQGYKAINVLFQYLTQSKEPPKEILMDCQIVFKESIDDEK